MQYIKIEPPSYQPLREMTQKEAKKYYTWFVDQIPKRIAVLDLAIRSSLGADYQRWEADRTPASLDLLGQWLMEHVEAEPSSEEFKQRRTEAIERIPSQYQSMFNMPEKVLTDVTFSLIIDVGMYLGDVLQKRFPQLEWQLWTKNKRDIDYHAPVLVGFKKGKICNPQRLVHIFVLGLLDKTRQPAYLHEIFDNWVYRETEW